MSRGELGRKSAGRLADAIAKRRADLGLRQSEVAERMAKVGVPISMQTISAWEYGRPRIASHQIVALAVSLECTTSYLLGLTEKPDKWTPDAPIEDLALRVSRDGKGSYFEIVNVAGERLSEAQYIQTPLVRGVSSSRASNRHRRADD